MNSTTAFNIVASRGIGYTPDEFNQAINIINNRLAVLDILELYLKYPDFDMTPFETVMKFNFFLVKSQSQLKNINHDFETVFNFINSKDE